MAVQRTGALTGNTDRIVRTLVDLPRQVGHEPVQVSPMHLKPALVLLVEPATHGASIRAIADSTNLTFRYRDADLLRYRGAGNKCKCYQHDADNQELVRAIFFHERIERMLS